MKPDVYIFDILAENDLAASHGVEQVRPWIQQAKLTYTNRQNS